MKLLKLSKLQNLCNQGNIAKSHKTSLFQYNYIVMIGTKNINNNTISLKHIPIKANISKDGEIHISGIDAAISEDNIYIHTDRKVTDSKG